MGIKYAYRAWLHDHVIDLRAKPTLERRYVNQNGELAFTLPGPNPDHGKPVSPVTVTDETWFNARVQAMSLLQCGPGDLEVKRSDDPSLQRPKRARKGKP